MALPDLAATTDLTARGISWTSPGEDTIVDTFLTVASTMVREAAGSPILQTSGTVTLDGHQDQRLALPGPPIIDVTTVLLDTIEVTDWRLAGETLWRRQGWTNADGPSEVTVTMTHGLPSVPADIIDLVCGMVAAALKAQREKDDGTGLAARDPAIQAESESVSTYSTSTTYATGAEAATTAATAMALPTRVRDALRERFGGAAAVVASR